VAEAVVAKAAQALGAGVAALINLCNPEMIILGGGVMEAGEILMEPVRRWARFYAFERAFSRTRLVRSGLSKQSGVLGAAALFLYQERRRDTA
jgi:glucokinase